MSAKILFFGLVFFTTAQSVSCNSCSEAEPSTEDAEATSGECLMQNQLLKGTVKADEMTEDGVADESDSDSMDATDADATDATDAEDEAANDEVSDQESTQDEVSQQQDVQEPQIPKCSSKADCGEGQGCVGGICIKAGSLKYKWTLATKNKKCKGKIIDKLDKGNQEIMTCKKKCQSIPGCTGFNRGIKGAVEAKCWFFDSCTKDTPKGQLDNSPVHHTYFVSATAEVEVTKQVMQTVKESKNMKVLGLTQGGEDKKETEEHAESEHEEAQHEEELTEEHEQEPTKCAAAAECKGEGQDCMGGICVLKDTVKFRWTLATKNKKCKGKAIDKLDKGKQEIMDCKKKCNSIPGCTGFNRGIKGAVEAKCWFFDSCTKDTPVGQLDNSPVHHTYYTWATADVEIVTVTKKNMKVLG